MTQIAELFARYHPVWHRMAWRILGNATDAEDAVQDAMVSACRNFHQFRGEAQLSTWLGKIVINTALMQRRGRRTFESLEEMVFVDRSPFVDQRPTPERDYAAAQECKRLHLAIVRLTPVLRRAVELRHMQEMSIREAASLLGVPEGTLKARSARARGALSKALGRTEARCRA
jgi:RNA polymerase sigma-70 factor (ECF subfamily)